MTGPIGVKVGKLLSSVHCEVASCDAAGADVVDDGVTEDVLLPVLRGDAVAGLADDDGEFSFVVCLRGV